MMPTAVIIAMAVESAPTRTEVHRKEAARLREASSASIPRSLPRSVEETEVRASTNAGMASGDATTRRIAARYPSNGLPSIAGEQEAAPAARPSDRAIHKYRAF